MGRSRVRDEAHASSLMHRARWGLALAAVLVAVTAMVDQASGAAASSRMTDPIGPPDPTAPHVPASTAGPASPVSPAVPAAATPATPATPATAVPVVTPATVAVAAPAAKPACRKGVVALTFDDGPAKVVTERLLGILEQHHVPATFFMVGSRVRSAPAVAHAVQQAGFQVGNHTWDHKPLTSLTKRGIRAELRGTDSALVRAGVTRAPLMRPPYGAVDQRVRAVAKSMGMVPVLWTVDSNDWRGKPRKAIARSVLAQLRAHRPNVVLQHDGVTNSPASVAAVPAIIAKARQHGYCFGSLGPDGRPHPPVPTLAAQVVAGNETGPTPATITLTLSEPTSHPVSVHVTTGSGTGSGTATPGADFSPLDATVTFPVGARTATISIPVVDDFLLEGTETFALELTAATGLTVPSSVAVPITDNE